MCCQPKALAAPLSFNTPQGFVLFIKQIIGVQQRLPPALGRPLCWLANLFEEVTKSIFSAGIHRADLGPSSLILCVLDYSSPSPGERNGTDESPFPIFVVLLIVIAMLSVMLSNFSCAYCASEFPFGKISIQFFCPVFNSLFHFYSLFYFYFVWIIFYIYHRIFLCSYNEACFEILTVIIGYFNLVGI